MPLSKEDLVDVLALFDAAQQRTTRKKAVTYNANTQYAHGPRGLFNTPGADPDVYSTIQRPQGLSRTLPIRKSVDRNPVYSVLTNLGDESGSEPADDCSPAPKSGNAYIAHQTAPFGKIIRDTDTIVVADLGQRINRGEPMDLRVVNDMGSTSPFVPDPARNPEFVQSEEGLQLWKLGMTIERVVETDVFTGNPASNSNSTKGRKYFAGLDLLINTSKIDAETGMSVPALDSLLVDWNNADVAGTVTLNGRSADIVSTLSAMENYFYVRAQTTGAIAAERKLAMRYDLFWRLTEIWPCSYLTNNCSTPSNGTVFVQGAEQVAMRDEMRTGQFLWINGRRIAVEFSDKIDETVSAGRLNSDIYWLNTSANGRYTLYFEAFDFENDQNRQWRNNWANGEYWTSNDGIFMWTFERARFCEILSAKLEIRLINRTPWLCGRLQNVGYSALIHTLTSSGLYAAPAGGSIVGASAAPLYNGY